MINKWLIIGVLGVVVLFFGITNNNVKEDVVVYFPIDKDFLNPNQGSAVFNFRFPETGFKVGNEFADSLMFLDSQTVPNLKILYNQKEKRIYAGNPLLITKEVIILDGKDHKIEYTFDRNQKQQAILLDGDLLASGEFSDIAVLTGYVVHKPIKLVESYIPIEVIFE